MLAITSVTLFILLPRGWRALAALIPVGLPILFGYAVAGVNAIVMATFLLGAAYRWTEIGKGGRLSRHDWISGVCLGLAMGSNQLAWFLAPFLVVGIYRLRAAQLGRARAVRLAQSYAALACGVFVLVNLPFIVSRPNSWMSSVISPLTQHAIPYGQGLISAALFVHVGGGDLRLFSYGAGLLFLGLLTLYTLYFRRLGRACFVLSVVPLFVSTRSLAEYFMTLIAVWIVSLQTTHDADFELVPRIRWPSRAARRASYIAPLLPAVVLLGLALTATPPLSVRITGVRTTGQLQSVWEIQVEVHNDSSEALHPHFATNVVGQASSFWNQTTGPALLAPHMTAHYSLVAPNVGSMPGITTPFLLEAMTHRPDTISTARLFTPQHYSVLLAPSYLNQVITPGGTATISAQLISPFGYSVHKPGVRVALAQLIYGQDALIPSEAEVNRGQEGETPVYAVTDAGGVARFRLRDASPQGEPVYFQAWVYPKGGYPYGYSEIVSVNWR